MSSDVQRLTQLQQAVAAGQGSSCSDLQWLLDAYDALARQLEVVTKQLDEEMRSHNHTMDALRIQLPAYEQRCQELERQLADVIHEREWLRSYLKAIIHDLQLGGTPGHALTQAREAINGPSHD